jgi:hypothetical protein
MIYYGRVPEAWALAKGWHQLLGTSVTESDLYLRHSQEDGDPNKKSRQY